MTNSTTRRRFLKSLAAVAGVGLAGWGIWRWRHDDADAASSISDWRELTIHGGTATPSIPLIHLAASNLLTPAIEKTLFSRFRGPDEVHVGLIGDGWPISMAPTHMAASLYNKGLPIRYLAVLTWGLLYLVSTKPGIQTLGQLRNSRVMLFSKGDLYDRLFDHLIAKAGLKAGVDVDVSYTGSPVETIQMLKTGRVDHALLAEPQVTAALANPQGLPLYRSFPLGDVQRSLTGDAAMPIAGLILHQRLIDERPDIVDRLEETLPQAVDWTLNHPDEAAREAQPVFSMPTDILARSIEWSGLTADSARNHRDRMDRYFQAIAEADVNLIGGRLPDDGFYL